MRVLLGQRIFVGHVYYIVRRPPKGHKSIARLVITGRKMLRALRLIPENNTYLDPDPHLSFCEPANYFIVTTTSRVLPLSCNGIFKSEVCSPSIVIWSTLSLSPRGLSTRM